MNNKQNLLLPSIFLALSHFLMLFLGSAGVFESCTNVSLAKRLYPHETQQGKDNRKVYFKTLNVDGLNIFYR